MKIGSFHSLFLNEKSGIEIRELLRPVPSGEERGISVFIFNVQIYFIRKEII